MELVKRIRTNTQNTLLDSVIQQGERLNKSFLELKEQLFLMQEKLNTLENVLMVLDGEEQQGGNSDDSTTTESEHNDT